MDSASARARRSARRQARSRRCHRQSTNAARLFVSSTSVGLREMTNLSNSARVRLPDPLTARRAHGSPKASAQPPRMERSPTSGTASGQNRREGFAPRTMTRREVRFKRKRKYWVRPRTGRAVASSGSSDDGRAPASAHTLYSPQKRVGSYLRSTPTGSSSGEAVGAVSSAAGGSSRPFGSDWPHCASTAARRMSSLGSRTSNPLLVGRSVLMAVSPRSPGSREQASQRSQGSSAIMTRLAEAGIATD
jgi:hypothetical protein